MPISWRRPSGNFDPRTRSRASRSFLGVTNARVVVRLLTVLRMEEEDLESAISFEARNHITMALDEAVFDYVVLGPQQKGSDLDRILVVAAHRGMIRRYTSAVRADGLKPLA